MCPATRSFLSAFLFIFSLSHISFPSQGFISTKGKVASAAASLPIIVLTNSTGFPMRFATTFSKLSMYQKNLGSLSCGRGRGEARVRAAKQVSSSSNNKTFMVVRPECIWGEWRQGKVDIYIICIIYYLWNNQLVFIWESCTIICPKREYIRSCASERTIKKRRAWGSVCYKCFTNTSGGLSVRMCLTSIWNSESMVVPGGVEAAFIYRPLGTSKLSSLIRWRRCSNPMQIFIRCPWHLLLFSYSIDFHVTEKNGN